MKIVIDTDTLTKGNIDAAIAMLSALQSSLKRDIGGMSTEEFFDAAQLSIRATNVIRSHRDIKTVADIEQVLKREPRNLGGPKTQTDISRAISELKEKSA